MSDNQHVGYERAVLSALIQFGKDALTDVEDIISVNTFTNDLNQHIFNAIKAVLSESDVVDIPSILGAANRLGYTYLSQKQENVAFLRSLTQFPAKLENCRTNAKVIAKLEIARKLKVVHKQCFQDLDTVSGSESLSEILSRSETPIFDAVLKLGTDEENTPQNIAKDGEAYIQHLLENKVDCIGIPSPFTIWNEAVGGGFIRGGVTMFVARMKVGKSTIALQCALHAALNLKIPVLYLDTELTRLTQQYVRALSNISGVPFQKILKGKFDDEKQKVVAAHRQLENSPFVHQRIAGTPFPEVISIIRRWIHQRVGVVNGKANPCLIVYDWFKLADSSALENLREDQAIGFQMSQLNDVAGQYEVPVIGLGQTNRDGITKEDTSVVGMSDRLAQLCVSLTLLKKKTHEEILEEGKDNGNIKMLTLDCCRFGPGLDFGSHINLQLDGAISRVKELGLSTDSKPQEDKEMDGNSDILF